MAAALAVALPLAVAADENDWVYTPETHPAITPATTVGSIAGLDAKARGFDAAEPGIVDKWYWTRCISNVYLLDFSKLKALRIYFK